MLNHINQHTNQPNPSICQWNLVATLGRDGFRGSMTTTIGLVVYVGIVGVYVVVVSIYALPLALTLYLYLPLVFFAMMAPKV